LTFKFDTTPKQNGLDKPDDYIQTLLGKSIVATVFDKGTSGLPILFFEHGRLKGSFKDLHRAGRRDYVQESTWFSGHPNPSATRRFRIRIREQDFESSQQHYSFPKVFVVVTVLPHQLSIMVVEKELLKRSTDCKSATSATLLSEVHNAMSDLQTPKNGRHTLLQWNCRRLPMRRWSAFGRPEIGWLRRGADRNRAYVIVACDTQRFARPLTESETEKYHIEFR